MPSSTSGRSTGRRVDEDTADVDIGQAAEAGAEVLGFSWRSVPKLLNQPGNFFARLLLGFGFDDSGLRMDDLTSRRRLRARCVHKQGIGEISSGILEERGDRDTERFEGACEEETCVVCITVSSVIAVTRMWKSNIHR